MPNMSSLVLPEKRSRNNSLTMNIDNSFLQNHMYNNLSNNSYLEMAMEDDRSHHHLHDHTTYSSFLPPFSWSSDSLFQPLESPYPPPQASHFLSNSSPLLINHHKNEENLQASEKGQEDEEEEDQEEELGAMKEMMFRIAAMQPVDIDPATIRKPKRRNVRISDDPQSVAARQRREKISEKIRILQRLVPGGTKMDTATMLEEAIRYVKFLKRQIRELESDHRKQNPDQDVQTWEAAIHHLV